MRAEQGGSIAEMQGGIGVQSRVSELEQTEEGGPCQGWDSSRHRRYHRALIKSINILLMEARFHIVRKDRDTEKEKARITPGVGFQLKTSV